MFFIKKSCNFAEQILMFNQKSIQMKKIIIACAVLMAGVLSSCGDTNYCYEVTQKYNLLGQEFSATTHIWGTSNELDVAIDEIEADLEAMGLSKDAYTIKYKKANKSQEECY